MSNAFLTGERRDMGNNESREKCAGGEKRETETKKSPIVIVIARVCQKSTPAPPRRLSRM